MGTGKIPLEKMNTRAIPEGLQYGLQFMTRDDPNVSSRSSFSSRYEPAQGVLLVQ